MLVLETIKKYLTKNKKGITPMQATPELILPKQRIVPESKTDYKAKGFEEAGKCTGEPLVYSTSLDIIYSDLLIAADDNDEFQAEEEHLMNSQINSLKEEIKNLENENKLIESEKIKPLETEYSAKKKDHQDLLVNPEKYVRVVTDKFRMVTAAVLTGLLAVSLYFFYCSVVYSAIFRVYTPENASQFTSIVYPNALYDAIHTGVLTSLVTFLTPFGFLSLAYLAHYLKKNIWYKGSVYVVSLALDGLLAFYLARKIFEAKDMNSFHKIAEYNLWTAFGDVNFWVVLGLGFVMYIVLGFVLGLYDEERSFKTKYETMLQCSTQEVNLLESKIETLKQERATNRGYITTKQNKIANMILPRTNVFYRRSKLVNQLASYTQGWLLFLSTINSENQNKQYQVTQAYNNFIKQAGLENNA